MRRAIVICAGAFLALGVLVYSCGKIGGPTYQRSAMITDIAWGKDGSLYMRVHWYAAEHLPGDNEDNWNTIVSFSDDAVYRLDPKERVVRMLPMAEAKQIVERWPGGAAWFDKRPQSKAPDYLGQGHSIDCPIEMYRSISGWVGGRFEAYAYIKRDTYFENEGTGRGPIPRVGPDRLIRRILIDWETGETRVLSAGDEFRVSPDDRYLVYQEYRNGAPGRVGLRWLPEGREAVGLERAFPVGRSGLPYPTTEGLLDVGRRLMIDPVTFDTKPGWDPFIGSSSPMSVGPNGQSNASLSLNDRILSVNFYPTDASWPLKTGKPFWENPDKWGAGWSFPSESVVGVLPSEWKDLDKYPKEYRLGGGAP